MFCPQCKAEYRPGYTRCADCGVPLVDHLPPTPEPEQDEPADAVPFGPDTELVHILDTFNPGDVALIKSILEGEGIPYVFEGEHSQYVYGAVPFRLMVDSQDADKVREVLKQLDLSHGQTNTTGAQFDEVDEDQDEGEVAAAVDGKTNIPTRPTGLSMKWVLVGLLIAGALLAYFYQSGNDSAADLSAKGRNAAAEGNFREARSYYEKAIKLDPRSDDFRYRVGLTYEMEGDLKDALRLYDEAIALNPRNSDAHSHRAHVLVKLRDYKRALEEIDEAVNLSPGNARLRAERGFIYSRLLDFPQELASYTEAIDLDPDFALAYVNRGLAWEHLGDADQAKKDYDRALQFEPKGPRDYVSRGIALQRLGRFGEAVGDFDKVLASFPKESDVYSRRGWSYLFFEDYDRAAADCGKAIDLDPGKYYAYGCRARAYNGSGKGRAAIEDCAKAIWLEPDEPAGYAWMAWTLATCQEQKYRDGKRALQYALEGVARSEKAKEGYLAEYYDALAAAYAETGDFTQAAQTEQKTLGLHRPPGAIIRDDGEAREVTEAYKSGQTYVQWRGKRSKNER
jgi:tetratricopeptide (TPR) repeat protein